MKVEICYDSIKETIEVTNFYKEIAEKLVEIGPDPAKTVRCTVGRESVSYKLCKRSGTIFIVEISNTLPDSLIDFNVESKYLTCINPAKNSYKFYRLIPCGSEVKVLWGRMGSNPGERFGEKSFVYSNTMFWIKYQEKISKGYIDQSKLYLADEIQKLSDKETEKVEEDSASKRLFTKLRNLSKKAVHRAQVRVPITQPIIDESKRLLDVMRNCTEVDKFNDHLLKLMSISQRPVRTGDGKGVKELMAVKSEDFKKIILRESDLIQAMEGAVTGYKVISGDFMDFDTEVYEANEKQRKQVMKLLNPGLHDKVKNIYRVIPREQQKRFDEYLKNNDIKTVKQYWHGSRNENWLSIIKSGLQLNPDAVITGKMFGEGIYFAPSSMKSWNYTSFRGTSWAGGNSDIAFMGVYATAYGKPYDVSTWSRNTAYNKLMIEQNGANCLHAHAGTSLRNDEIIFYDEAACVLNYIVEFGE